MNKLKRTKKNDARKNGETPMVSLLRLIMRFGTASNFGYFVIDSDSLRRIYWWRGKFLGYATACTFGGNQDISTYTKNS